MIFFIVLTILFLDQSTKYIAGKNLYPGESIPLIKGVLHLTLVHNRGAAFGILKDQFYLFIFSSIFALILIVFSLKGHSRKGISIYTLSLSLIAAGAVGNLIDRIFLGYVIDFLDFRVWPVFNVADSAITVGAVLLGMTLLFERSHRDTRTQGHKLQVTRQ
jgi:signal peptidase II